jgi:hypothetical protein
MGRQSVVIMGSFVCTKLRRSILREETETSSVDLAEFNLGDLNHPSRRERARQAAQPCEQS